MEIQTIKSKEALGFDLITREILKMVPRKAIAKMNNLINASFKLNYEPNIWNVT